MELQALNSDRFRHRFLEKNRPWILQHLVELLTPRTIEKEGPDGRPTIEYLRDVYQNLLTLGEGARRKGDREDISSDEEDDLEDARRNWSNQPLTGGALAIARMWLAKARKRRYFNRLIAPTIEQNRKAACELCGRNPIQHGARLITSLATDGQPDRSAIDNLISGFEGEYGYVYLPSILIVHITHVSYAYSVNEMDTNLWKAYFRMHAQYCTRCEVCNIKTPSEQDGLPGTEDLSSDEDDDEDAEFDIVEVSRTSPVGKMMSKWLLAARKKLGGPFPRPHARAQVDQYAKRLRAYQIKKAKRMSSTMVSSKLQGRANDGVSNNQPLSAPGSGNPNLPRTKAGSAAAAPKIDRDSPVYSAATEALALRWIRMAKESIESKRRNKTYNALEDTINLLEIMGTEHDWYYSSTLRIEGEDLVREGKQIQDKNQTLESEALIKIRKIEVDRDKLISDAEIEIIHEQLAYDLKRNQLIQQHNTTLTNRIKEIETIRDQCIIQHENIKQNILLKYNTLPPDLLQQQHSEILAYNTQIQRETQTLTLKHEKELKDLYNNNIHISTYRKNTIQQYHIDTSNKIAQIRSELYIRLKGIESEWHMKAIRWNSIARKKIELKQKDDEMEAYMSNTGKKQKK